jgi:hypothetical protein
MSHRRWADGLDALRPPSWGRWEGARQPSAASMCSCRRAAPARCWAPAAPRVPASSRSRVLLPLPHALPLLQAAIPGSSPELCNLSDA